jgi:hypothetical protein
MAESTIALTPKIVNNDALLGEAIEAFLSTNSTSYEGQTTLVVLQDALQAALSQSDWGLYLELESLGQERSCRVQEALIRWSFSQGVRHAEAKARNRK